MSPEPSASELGSNGYAHSPDVLAAEEKVRQAREELQRAEEEYQALRREAAQREGKIPSLGDVFHEVLRLAGKYPLPSLLTAASIGFILGKILRR